MAKWFDVSIALGLVATATLVLTHSMGSASAGSAVQIPAPAFDARAPAHDTRATAVLAGGCFWGIQAVFQHTKGVLNAVSGYAGGEASTADYESVSSGATGHAEAVQITYDPRQVTYGNLLQIFFSVAHDPTQLNRQFPDTGTQYRSAVFYVNPIQKQVADRYLAQLDAARVFRSRIVTQVAPLTAFYPAEPYHQDYATVHPAAAYIVAFDAPKLVNLQRMFPELSRATPVLVAAQASATQAAHK
jgi:peptide-methionine (S)-S-oxide reductase